MADLKSPNSIQEFPKTLLSQMIVLSTSGFGVVVALAWNEFIKNLVDVYIKPYLGQGSGVWSLFLYAVVITTIAVLVTMQLTKLRNSLEWEEEEEREKTPSKEEK